MCQCPVSQLGKNMSDYDKDFPENTSIVEAMHDEKYFKNDFSDLNTWKKWEEILTKILCPKAPSGTVGASDEASVIEPPSSVFLIAGRRSGKSRMASMIAVYKAFFGDYSKDLSPGEVGEILLIGRNREQCTILLNYIRAFTEKDIFQKYIKKDRKSDLVIKNRNNKIRISVKACDFRGTRGYTSIAVILEELAFYRAEGQNRDKEILTAVKPTLATVENSLLLGISSAYTRSGVLYEVWKDNKKNPRPDRLVLKFRSDELNPNIKKEFIENEVKNDVAMRAEYLSEFRTDITAFLSENLIKEACQTSIHKRTRDDLYHYIGAFDSSSGRGKDSSALSIAHQEIQDGKRFLVQDLLIEWKPPFRPKQVIRQASEILKRWGIGQVLIDKFAIGFVEEFFQEFGIACNYTNDKSRNYLDFQPLLIQGEVRLLDNEKLKEQFLGLERITRRTESYDKIEAGLGGHEDLSDATVSSLLGAKTLILSEDETKARMPQTAKSGAKNIIDTMYGRNKNKWLREAEEEMKDFIGGNGILRSR